MTNNALRKNTFQRRDNGSLFVTVCASRKVACRFLRQIPAVTLKDSAFGVAAKARRTRLSPGTASECQQRAPLAPGSTETGKRDQMHLTVLSIYTNQYPLTCVEKCS